jgi:hypothetical protein
VVDEIVHDGVPLGGSKPHAARKPADIAVRHPGALDFRPRVSVQVCAVLLGSIADTLEPEALAVERDITSDHEAMPCARPEIASHEVVRDHGISAPASDRSSTRPGKALAESDGKDEEEDGATHHASSHTPSIGACLR